MSKAVGEESYSYYRKFFSKLFKFSKAKLYCDKINVSKMLHFQTHFFFDLSSTDLSSINFNENENFVSWCAREIPKFYEHVEAKMMNALCF